jgi:hypothetical protein
MKFPQGLALGIIFKNVAGEPEITGIDSALYSVYCNTVKA